MQANDEFWNDDAAALANREAQRELELRTGLRMPPASPNVSEDLKGSHATASADWSTFRPAAAQGLDQKAVTPPEKSAAKGCFLLIAAFLALVVFARFQLGNVRTPSTHKAEQGVAGSMLKEQERELQRLVGEMIGSGVLLKVVTSGKTPEMYVLPAFHLLDIDRKTQIVTTVYHVTHRLAMDGAEYSGRLWVYDGLTGEHLRTFDKSFYGLQW